MYKSLRDYSVDSMQFIYIYKYIILVFCILILPSCANCLGSAAGSYIGTKSAQEQPEGMKCIIEHYESLDVPYLVYYGYARRVGFKVLAPLEEGNWIIANQECYSARITAMPEVKSKEECIKYCKDNYGPGKCEYRGD